MRRSTSIFCTIFIMGMYVYAVFPSETMICFMLAGGTVISIRILSPWAHISPCIVMGLPIMDMLMLMDW